MQEKYLEQKLRTLIESKGGMALKLISPGLAGVPDRLVLLPNGRICFVELKKPGMKMRALQLKRKKQLETLGFSVYCVDSIESLKEFMEDFS